MSVCSAIMAIWMAWFAVVFLSSLCCVEGKHSLRCSNGTESTTTLRPSTDGVKARYVLEWCTFANPNDTIWEYNLVYSLDKRYPRIFKNSHSGMTELLNWTDAPNCDYVCLSTNVDLVFNATYSSENKFLNRGSQMDVTTHFIVNEYRKSDFTSFDVKGAHINHGDYVAVNFLLTNIPAEYYWVDLCNETKKRHEDEPRCRDVSTNCSTPYSVYEIICKLHLPNGEYKVELQFYAPWRKSDFLTKQSYVREISHSCETVVSSLQFLSLGLFRNKEVIMSDSECEIQKKSTSVRKASKTYRSDSEFESEVAPKKPTRARKSKRIISDSESEGESASRKPTGRSKTKKTSSAGKKRKTSNEPLRKSKIYELFGIGSSREEEEVPSSTKKILPSYFINRVANGNERRTAQTSGNYYVDLKIYESSDAIDIEPANLWKKALVRIKFQTSEESDQWRGIQNLVKSANSLFKSEPHLYVDK